LCKTPMIVSLQGRNQAARRDENRQLLLCCTVDALNGLGPR
jgi:hypothetical protein